MLPSGSRAYVSEIRVRIISGNRGSNVVTFVLWGFFEFHTQVCMVSVKVSTPKSI